MACGVKHISWEVQVPSNEDQQDPQQERLNSKVRE